MITRVHTMGVNDAEDGVLSTVEDTAIVDVSGLRNVSLMINQTAFALLDLDSITTNVDTVIRALNADAIPTIAFEDGAGANAGTITEDVEAGTIVIAFKNGGSTVAHIEALIATSELIAIYAAGTGAAVLATTDDEFSATPLALDAATFSLVVEKTNDGTNWSTIDTYDESDFPVGSAKSFEITLSETNGRSIQAKQVIVTLSAMAGANSFSLTAVGLPLPGYA